MATLKCLVLNDREPIPETLLDQFRSRLDVVWYQVRHPVFDLRKALATNSDSNIIVTTYMDLSATNLSLLHHLKAIVTTTTAIEYIDADYCRRSEIRVYNNPAYTGSSVAEHAFAMGLAALRRLCVLDARVRAGDYECFDVSAFELEKKHAGIIGLGSIGARIARIAAGFEMNVSFFTRRIRESPLGRWLPLRRLLETSDLIFVAVPLNKDSYRILGRAEIAFLKPTSIVISTSPDEVIDQHALAAALTAGKIRGAALDLHQGGEHLLGAPNVLLTPRRAGATLESVARRNAGWVNKLTGYLNGDGESVV